jgi:hypothetical protein
MDATAMKEAKEELAKLVAAQAAEDVWTTPAMNEKIRIEKLARQLAKTGDPEAQRFVAEQVTLCKHVNTAGDMARALTVEQDLPGPADPQALAKIVALFDTANPTTSVFAASVRAMLVGDPEKAFAKLAPLFDATSVDWDQAKRLQQIAAAMFLSSKRLRPLVERVLLAAARLKNRELDFAVFNFPGGPGWDEERAHLVALDLPPELVANFVFRTVAKGCGLDSKRVKVMLPLLQAEAAPLRDDPKAKARIEAVEAVLKLPGALLGTAKVKVPKAAPTVALKQEVASEGGPLLALPKEALAAWRGVLLPNGKPGEGDFAGTVDGTAARYVEMASDGQQSGQHDGQLRCRRSERALR